MKKECPFCGRKYKNLINHVRKKHPQRTISMSWIGGFGNSIPCKVCGEVPTRLQYSEDEDVFLCEDHYEGYTCPECGRWFWNRHSYSAHWVAHGGKE